MLNCNLNIKCPCLRRSVPPLYRYENCKDLKKTLFPSYNFRTRIAFSTLIRRRACLTGSRHVLNLASSRFGSTALAVKPSSSDDTTADKRGTATQYTGTFSESEPSEHGRDVLRKALLISHQDLLHLDEFCNNIQDYFVKYGSVVKFDDFPGWSGILPVIAKRFGLRHLLITSSHPYYEQEHGVAGLHILLRSNATRRLVKNDHGLAAILHDYTFVRHLQDWINAISKDAKVHKDQDWKLLLLACRNNPHSMPRLEITGATGKPVSQRASGVCDVQRFNQLRLVNDHHDIIVARCFDDIEDYPKSLSMVIKDYIGELSKPSQPRSERMFRFIAGAKEPAELLGRAISALGWGSVSFHERPVLVTNRSLTGLTVWRVAIHASKHGMIGQPVEWTSRKHARLSAILKSCIYFKEPIEAAYRSGRIDFDEYRVFAQYWADGSDVKQEQLITQQPELPSQVVHNVMVNDSIVSTMLESLRSLVHAGFQSDYERTRQQSPDLELQISQCMPLMQNLERDRSYYQEYCRRLRSGLKVQQDLPVSREATRSKIIEAIKQNTVTIITAATGSGKTTQIPQMIFDQWIAESKGSLCSIACTQPRRVSTIAVATRVASERSQDLCFQVGYKVRYDHKPTLTPSGITYMTSGYFLRMLESNPGEVLMKHSHIILDEVHARDADTDLIMTALMNCLGHRTALDISQVPKIILMSATINAEFFRDYFENLGSHVKVAIVDIPGRTYQVKNNYLRDCLVELRDSHAHELDTLLQNSELGLYVSKESSLTNSSDKHSSDQEENNGSPDDSGPEAVLTSPRDLYVPVMLVHLMITRLLSTTPSGDILVFLPGLGEIDTLEGLLKESSPSANYLVFKLHSALYATNFEVFDAVPDGHRRVVLATNIAETSITLPQVKFVIDTGLSRQSTFDQITQSGTFGLQWISKAEVMQRRGRAGRTHAGFYYGMYSEARYTSLSDVPRPEVLRTSLDNLVLRGASSSVFRLRATPSVRSLGLGDVLAGQSLLTSPSPPDISHVAAAAKQLVNIRALDTKGQVTLMGRILSHLPMAPAAAKTVLLGMIFRCLDPLLVFGTLRDDLPLMFDATTIAGVVERRKKLAGNSEDDRWASYKAFILYDGYRRRGTLSAAQKVQEEYSIRHDAYCEYAHSSRQTFDILWQMLKPDKEDISSSSDLDDVSTPLFPSTPRSLNVNGANSDLAKALALSTSGTRLACWNIKHWRTEQYNRVLPHPKSVNHNNNKRAILAQRILRENGDLLTYSTMRTVPRDKYPWLHETAPISPMMAILFAESIALIEDEATFVINGWIRYKVTSEDPEVNVRHHAKIIWEYRKALDRFLMMALKMVSTEPWKVKGVRDGTLKIEDFNVFLREEDHPFRKIFMDSVVKILDIDSADRGARAELRALDEQTATHTS